VRGGTRRRFRADKPCTPSKKMYSGLECKSEPIARRLDGGFYVFDEVRDKWVFILDEDIVSIARHAPGMVVIGFKTDKFQDIVWCKEDDVPFEHIVFHLEPNFISSPES